jgi:hypothetical protein
MVDSESWIMTLFEIYMGEGLFSPVNFAVVMPPLMRASQPRRVRLWRQRDITRAFRSAARAGGHGAGRY